MVYVAWGSQTQFDIQSHKSLKGHTWHQEPEKPPLASY